MRGRRHNRLRIQTPTKSQAALGDLFGLRVSFPDTAIQCPRWGHMRPANTMSLSPWSVAPHSTVAMNPHNAGWPKIRGHRGVVANV